MSTVWEVIKKVFVGIGLFIGGFFLLKRGIDAHKVSNLETEEKAKEEEVKASAQEEIKVRKKQVDEKYEEKKKEKAEELKKKSKNSKTKPKKKKQTSKNSPKKIQKSSRGYSRKSSK